MAEPLTPEMRDALAAELALGVLEGEERAQALRLSLSDPDFAAAVAAWRARLDPLCADFAEVSAPALWPAIERRLGQGSAGPGATSLRRWRLGALGSAALAASLAAILLLRPASVVEIVRPPEQAIVAQLSGEGDALLAASYDPAQGVLRIRAVHMPQSDLAPELWVIPADGVPRSLGLVSASGLSRVGIAVPHRALLHEGATLAITMEPGAGAPHDKPSGAPVAAGKISTI